MSTLAQNVVVDDPPYAQLPREVRVSSSGQRILTTILGACLVVLLANWAARAYLAQYTSNRGYWLVGQKWRMLESMATPVDWLVLGDSSGNQGIITDLWAERLGGTAINLCTVANLTLLEDVWMLEYYGRRFGPPENVLLIHVYDMWYRELTPAFVARVPLPWMEMRQSLSTLLEANELSSVFALRYLPLYAENTTLSAMIMDGIRSPSRLFRQEFRVTPGGYMKAADARPQWVEYDTWGHVKFVTENEFVLSTANRAALEQLVALAERDAVNVYLVSSPLYQGLGEHEQFQAYYAQLEQTLRAWAAQSDRVHVLPLLSVFDADQMQNVDHVVHDGAARYTEDVAQAYLDSR